MMRISVRPSSDNDKVFTTMPSQTELTSLLTTYSNSNQYKRVVLPNGTLTLTSKLTIPEGVIIEGQGASYGDNNTKGTLVSISGSGQIELSSESQLKNLKINHNSNASVDAITNIDEAFGFKLENLKYYGGNTDIYAIHFIDHYEAFINDIYIACDGNGVYYDFTGPYNTGDQSVHDLRIRLQSPTTTGLKIDGSTTNNKKWNNIKFHNFYCTAADIGASWETSENIGIDMENTARHTFIAPNLEELQTGIELTGNVGSGGGVDRITIIGGYIHENIIANAGVTNIQLFNTQLSGTVSGASAENITQI